MCIPPCDSSPLYLGCSSASQSRQDLRRGLSFGEGRRSKRGPTTMRKIRRCDLLHELGRLALGPGIVGARKDEPLGQRRGGVEAQTDEIPGGRGGEGLLPPQLEGFFGGVTTI